MSMDSSDQWLAEFTYFWIGLVSFEIVISCFYTISKNGRPISKMDKKFKGVTRVTLIIVILATIYYFGENILHQPIVKNMTEKLGNTNFPLAVFSVSFFAFYTAKVMFNSDKKHKMVVSSLSITLVSLGIAILMFVNGNKLW